MIRTVALTYSTCTAVAALLLADGVTEPPWQAVAQLGLATVLAGVSFMGLIWWFKKNTDQMNADSAARDERISQLEKFQQEKLIELVEKVTEANSRSIEAIDRFTSVFEGRMCVAIQALTFERRQKVEALMRGED